MKHNIKSLLPIIYLSIQWLILKNNSVAVALAVVLSVLIKNPAFINYVPEKPVQKNKKAESPEKCGVIENETNSYRKIHFVYTFEICIQNAINHSKKT